MHVGFDSESAIEAFEQKRASNPSARIVDFLPPAGTASYVKLLIELIRVDMEFSWNEGSPRSISEYLQQYPELGSDKQALAKVGYEEYRQRRLAGQKPSPADYHQQYQIDVAAWPISLLEGDRDASLSRLTTQLQMNVTPALVDDVKKEDPPSGYFLSTPDRHLPKAGGTFLDFVLERELGQGAFGRVFLARQIGLAKRPVALKITAKRQQEPETLARLRHTNIMPIYSVHESGPFQAICMPYLGQVTLADLTAALRQRAHPPVSASWLNEVLKTPDSPGVTDWKKQSYVQQILHFGEKMAAGLSHAHARGIIHRDLKPANILLSNDGEPLVLDFNLATSIHGYGAAAALAGTLPYLAPEQIDQLVKGQGTPGSMAADVYALGLILYELLSGQFAYPNVTGSSMLACLGELARQRRRPPRYLRELNPKVSPALAAIVHKCLQRDPALRYQNALELHEDLQRQEQHQVLKYAADRSVAERFRKWTRRHPRAIQYALIVTLVAFVALTGVSLRHSYQQGQRQHYEALYRDRAAGLHRAEQLAAFFSAPRLQEAAELADQFLQATAAPTPEALPQQPFHQYVADRTRAEHPALVARAWLLQARLKKLQARTAAAEAAQRLDSEALQANEQAHVWCTALGDARPAQWQRHVLTSKDVPETLKALLEKPAEQLLSRELAPLVLDLLDAEHLTPATRLARRLVDQEPGWSDAWFLYGLVKARAGNFPEALHGFDTTVALDPDNPVALHFRAKVRTDLHDFEGALADYARALKAGLARVDILADRALVYMATQQFPKAQADLDEALQLEPAISRLYFLRSLVKRHRGDEAGAKADRAQGLARPPVDALGFVARALARREDQDWKGALADLEQAEKLNPASLAVLENQAEIWGEQLKQPEKALAVLNRAVKAVPEAPLLYTSRAVYHARLGHRQPSLQDVQTALQLSPLPTPLTLYHVACVYALNARTTPSDANQALVYLTAALERGFGREYVKDDPDLASLRGRPEYQTLLARFLGQ
jgi:serine/threonine protein kinase/Tfp pilus assembly protein PilF